ncbi:MAG: hypothetical protein CMG75_05865 [Candidatus Marinimicrobia bacterium]|nr:hypothetical protein [Candidatus Neomarinimicrobiota bacterium]|tara:strand:- start:5136 stop:6710 length:1575 start_codon:yes stop_codon:yes gene_type:complete
MNKVDVIIVGSGINSLVVASILSRAGKRVQLLEARKKIGGMASTDEFSPGFKCNILNDTIKWIDPRLLKNLDLESRGLEIIQPDIVRTAIGMNNNHIQFYLDLNKTIKSITKYSQKDSKNWKEFNFYINKSTQFLEKIYEMNPPELQNIGLKEIIKMRSMIGPLRKYGTRGIVDLLRVIPMMMPELVDEWFDNELLRSAISTAGIHHHSFGPYAAGTGYNLLHQHIHANGIFHNAFFIRGGTEKLALVLKDYSESFGAKIKCSARVTSINLENNCCKGITLQSGETFEANKVVSGLDPHNTFMKLINPSKLTPNFQRQLKNIRYRGTVARAHFALNRLPKINNISEKNMVTVFSICPSIEYLERASDGVKYGYPTDQPYIEFTIPSLINSDFAPSNKHVLSASIQYCPYHLRKNKWSSKLKNEVMNNVIKTIEKVSPEFSSSIEYSNILTPLDIENEFGLTEGNLNHGEMTLDQFMFMRPLISASNYKTPIKNLFLCGSGTHPGGGLHGTNGYNAATTILKNDI